MKSLFRIFCNGRCKYLLKVPKFHSSLNHRQFIQVPKSYPHLDFPQVENEHFYKVIMSNKLYKNTVAYLDYLNCKEEQNADISDILQCDFSEKPAYTLVCYLKMLLKLRENSHSIMEESQITNLLKCMTSTISTLSDQHFWNLLKILNMWPNREKDQRFFDMCKAVDEEAVRRLPFWGYDSILLTMDHFHLLRILRYCDFVYNGMRRLWRNPSKLTPQQLVHAMFIVISNRRWHPAVVLPEVEAALMFYIYDLNVEETAILALSFFKTKTSVTNVNLVEKIYDKLEYRIDIVDSITLAAYLKFFRLCTAYGIRHRTRQLLDLLVKRVDDVSVKCCTHIALVGTVNRVLHEPCLQKVCERFLRELPKARLKDIERLMLALETFNFTPKMEEDFWGQLIEEVRKRETEILEYPKTFLCLIHYLILKGHFNHDLINRALSISFLRTAYGELNKHTIPRDTFHIAASVKLECPNYRGSNLSERLIEMLSEHYSLKLPSNGRTARGIDTLLLSITNVLSRIFGSSEFVLLTYVLPFTSRPDILFCLKDGKPIQIPEEMRGKRYLPTTSPHDVGGSWYACSLLDLKYAIADTHEPIGSLIAKMRQLKILGYKCLLVNAFEWEKTDTDKIKYLKKLIGVKNY